MTTPARISRYPARYRAFAHAAAEPASTPVVVTGRSRHAVHHVIGSVPVQLLHESPYPVLTIA